MKTSTVLDLQTLQALNKRFIHNFVTNDVVSHDAMLHPAFRAITPKQGHLDRETYLRYWATGFDPGAIIYWDMRAEDICVVADTAFVTATNRWVRLHHGVEMVGMTCYTDTYLRTNGTWLCAHAQLTDVAIEHYPNDDSVVVSYVNGRLQSTTEPG